MVNDSILPENVINDARIQGMVEAIFLMHERLHKYQFSIVVKNQTVTLNGRVDCEVDQWLAKDILLGIKDIKNIYNHIKVNHFKDGQKGVNTENQQFYQSCSDASTTALIRSKLLWNKSLSGSEIKVTTKTGNVTLSGQVDYEANKALAELIVKNLRNIKNIENNIKVI